MNLVEMLNQHSHKKQTAIVFNKQKISYLQLNVMVNQLADGLSRLGLTKDNKVAMLLHNCPEFIITYFATLKIGAIIVPLNTFLTAKEIKFILEDCKADILVTETEFEKRIKETDFKKTIVWIDKEQLSWQKILIKEPKIQDVAIYEDDVSTLLYTSGTTGLPKGVMLSHTNLISNIESCLKIVKVFPKDNFLLFLPMFHTFSFTVCVLIPIMVGAKIILLRSVKPFKQIIKAIIFGRVTIFVGIPQVYNLLASAKIPWFFKYINPIRLCISGASALSQEILKKFESKLRIPLLEGYGMTEASPVISFNPPKGIRKPLSVGLPLPGIEVKIVDEDQKELPKEEVGEIIVKGKNVMLGYYNLPEATKQTIKNGWLYTGDMGKIDKDGYIYIIDRKKDMIISRGMNIYPREIEEILYTNPKIEDVAVIGEKDEHRGEIPIAIVTLKKGEFATEQEIIEFCQQKLAGYKVPKKIEFWSELPKTPTGKILKREIKKKRIS